MFVLDTAADNVGIPVAALIDPEFGARQAAFRQRVREGGLLVGAFADAATLGQLVGRSLRELADVARPGRTVARQPSVPVVVEGRFRRRHWGSSRGPIC